MMRSLAGASRSWLAGGLVAALVLGGLAGCQPTFLTKDVWDQAHTNMLPAATESDHCPPTAPITPEVKAPATVNFPDREQREMTLQEAIALALESGLVSGNAPEGTVNSNLVAYPGPGSLTNQSDFIRVLALNPAVAQAAIEASLARFDAVWINSASAYSTDAIPGVPNLPGVNGTVENQGGNFGSSIVKAFADGSVANVSFLVNYRNITNTGGEPIAFFGPYNPQYSARLSLGYEIPLWRDAGVDINSLLPHLSSVTGGSLTDQSALTGFNSQQSRIGAVAGQPVEGTLISRLRFDQSRAEFERNVAVMVKNVEIAYWNLYNMYGQLYSYEENLRILQRAYQESDIKLKAGNLDPYKFYQTKGQFEEFRGNRIQALQQVLNAELQLRGILGLPMEDGKRIVPITPPSLAEIKPDWQSCLQDALNLRPELVLARENVRYQQYQLQIQKNNLRPDLRAYMKYEPFGDGPSLVGASPLGTATDPFTGTPIPNNSAFRELASGHLVDWTAGVYMNIPLGFRFEMASVRTARLQLSQSYHFLREQELKAIIYLTDQYQEVHHWYQRIQAHRAERLAYVESLRKIQQKIEAGAKDWTYSNLEFLEVQRSYAAALVKEYGAIAEYNNALARLEFAKGTTLRYNNVHVSEGPLPQCAQVRAVDYQRQETQKALKLWSRPDALVQPGLSCAKKETDLLAQGQLPPVTITEGVGTLPTTAPPAPPAPPITDAMPATRPATPPIAPAAATAVPAEKVQFQASPAAPITLPSPNGATDIPAIPIPVQQTSSLQNPSWNLAPPTAPTPIVARGAFGDPTPR